MEEGAPGYCRVHCSQAEAGQEPGILVSEMTTGAHREAIALDEDSITISPSVHFTAAHSIGVHPHRVPCGVCNSQFAAQRNTIQHLLQVVACI